MISVAEITDVHKQVQDKLLYCYKPYVDTPLSTILDTLIMTKKLVRPHQYRQIDDKQRGLHNLLSI